MRTGGEPTTPTPHTQTLQTKTSKIHRTDESLSLSRYTNMTFNIPWLPRASKREGQFPFLSFFIYFLSTLVDKSILRIHHKIYICSFFFLLIIYLQLYKYSTVKCVCFLMLCCVQWYYIVSTPVLIHRMVPCEVTYRHN